MQLDDENCKTNLMNKINKNRDRLEKQYLRIDDAKQAVIETNAELVTLYPDLVVILLKMLRGK